MARYRRAIGLEAATSVWILAVAASCGTYEKLPKTDEFLSRLQCGMSEKEVAAVVAEFRGLKLKESQRGTPWDKVALWGRTTIALDFEDERLRQAEVIWVDGILSADSLPIHDFCSS